AYSPDGRLLATAGQNGSVKLWDAATGKELLTLAGHTSATTGIAFSRDGLRIASVGSRQKAGEISRCEGRFWDALTGQEILTLQGAEAQISSLAFSPDGRRLAVTGDSAVTIWDATSTSPMRIEEREALGFVRYLIEQKLPRSVALARIEYDETVSDTVR